MGNDIHSSEQPQNGTREDASGGPNGHDTGDWGLVQMALIARAKALQPGRGRSVDQLIADIGQSIVPRSTFGPLASTMGKAAQLDSKILKKEMDMARSAVEGPLDEREETPEERAARRAEAYSQCRRLAEAPDLMLRFIEDVQAFGIEQEEGAIISIQLTHISRLLDRPASLVRKGASSSGKSAVVNAVLAFSNEGDDWVGITSGSARSLVYKNGGVKHKTLYIMEAAGIATRANGDEDPMAVMLRSLLSEFCIKYQTVEDEKDPVTGRSRKVGRDIVMEGPTNAIITTARENIEDELATRLLVSYADESSDRTRAVIRRVFSPSTRPSDDRIEQWRALQTWLRLGPKRVDVPFGQTLANLISTDQLRMRRDAASLRALIEASALLHQAQRERNGDAIVATVDDYSWACAASIRGLDALNAGSEVDVTAVAGAIKTLLDKERRQYVQREAARGLAGLLLRGMTIQAAAKNPITKKLTRLNGKATTTYAEVKAVAAKGGLTISRADLRGALAGAKLTAPLNVRASGRRLAQTMGITYKIARVRLQRALEDGVVVDDTLPNAPRNSPSGRLLRCGDGTAVPKSTRRAIPVPDVLKRALQQASEKNQPPEV